MVRISTLNLLTYLTTAASTFLSQREAFAEVLGVAVQPGFSVLYTKTYQSDILYPGMNHCQIQVLNERGERVAEDSFDLFQGHHFCGAIMGSGSAEYRLVDEGMCLHTVLAPVKREPRQVPVFLCTEPEND